MKALWRSFRLVFVLSVLAIPGWAIGLIIVDQPGEDIPRLPHLRPIHRFTPLEIRSVQVSTKIEDQVARTKIEEEFYNPNANRLEGTFYLPLPKGAHLEKFALEVNGKMTEAELLTAEKAKSIYEEIVRKAQDPALLEYLGRDLVKVRIFPIEPHSTKRIELSYTQLLASDSGLVSYTLPMNTAKYCATAIKNLSAKIELETSTPLKMIYSPSHSPEIKRKSEKQAVVGFEMDNARPERDFQLLFSAERSELGLNFLTYKKPGEDGYFMLLATPGLSETKKAAPKDVVFVMDTSGSMSGAKIEQAKKALLFCINSLNAEDRFEIIRFSTEAESLFRKLSDVSEKTREQAEEFAKNLKATGGTAIHDALEEALKIRPHKSERPYFVVFVTDGRPTVGVTEEDEIVKAVKSGSGELTRVFCFGVGTDVNTHLLDRVGEETRAVSQYVLPDEDLEVIVSSFFGKISDPVLAEVELDFGTTRVSKLHPGKLPDLFKGQQVGAFGRYHGGGKGKVLLKGKARGEEKKFEYAVEFSEKSSDYEFIPRLWATRRVGHLLDEIRLRGENEELKEEVTALAKEYGIVTPYTSFLVTEDQPIGRPQITTSTAADPLQSYWANPQLMRRYFPHSSAPVGEPNVALRPEKSGDLAVAGSRYNSRLKDALSEAQAQSAPAEVRQFLYSGRLSEEVKGEDSPVLGERFVGRRTFRQQGGTWVEAQVLRLSEATPVRLEFDSKEYWAFAGAHPEMNDVLALGTDIRFLHEHKLHEVFSKK